MPDLQSPTDLTEKGRQAWQARRDREQKRLAQLAELKVEFERVHREWEQVREHYSGNGPVLAVLDGHEPSLVEGGGRAIRMPIILCDVDGFKDETGEWWGTWPCWTYEALESATES